MRRFQYHYLLNAGLSLFCFLCAPAVIDDAAAQGQENISSFAANQNPKNGQQDAVQHQAFAFRGHAGAVHDVAFSPDGKLLASAGGWDRTVKLWDAAKGQEVFVLRHSRPVVSLAFSPDGKRLATAGEGSELLLDSESPLARVGDIRLWDVERQQVVQKLKGHTYFVNRVAFTPDGLRLATASLDQTVIIWDAKTGNNLFTVRLAGNVHAVAFSPDGKLLATASHSDVGVFLTPKKPGEVRIWNADNGQALSTLRHTDDIWNLAFNPNGDRLAAVTRSIIFFGAVNPREQKTEELHVVMNLPAIKAQDNSNFGDVEFSPDGKLLAASIGREPFDNSGENPGELKLWNALATKELLSLKFAGPVGKIAFSADGRRLAAAGLNGTMRIWALEETHDGEITAPLADEPQQQLSGIWSPPKPPSKEIESWLAEIQPLAVESTESELIKLLKKRHNAAHSDATTRLSLSQEGRVGLDDVLEAFQRISRAGKELPLKPSVQQKYFEMAIDATRAAETIVQGKAEQGIVAIHEAARAKCIRLTAEIELQRWLSTRPLLLTRQTTRTAKSSELTKMLEERLAVAYEWADQLQSLFAGSRASSEAVLEATSQHCQSGVEAAGTGTERMEYLDQYLEELKAIEKIVRGPDVEYQGPLYTLHHATYARLDAEIAVMKARSADKSQASNKRPETEEGTARSQLHELLQSRYKAAADEVADARAVYVAGRLSLKSLLEAIERFAKAGTARYSKSPERITHLKSVFEATQELETLVREKFENGVEPPQTMYLATYARLDAEIALARALSQQSNSANRATVGAAETVLLDDFDPLELRRWTDNSGLYCINARLTQVLTGSVRLLKETGNTTTVPISRLSFADRQYVTEILRRYGNELINISEVDPSSCN